MNKIVNFLRSEINEELSYDDFIKNEFEDDYKKLIEDSEKEEYCIVDFWQVSTFFQQNGYEQKSEYDWNEKMVHTQFKKDDKIVNLLSKTYYSKQTEEIESEVIDIYF